MSVVEIFLEALNGTFSSSALILRLSVTSLSPFRYRGLLTYRIARNRAGKT